MEHIFKLFLNLIQASEAVSSCGGTACCPGIPAGRKAQPCKVFFGDQLAKQERAVRKCQSRSILSNKPTLREGKGQKMRGVDLKHYQ